MPMRSPVRNKVHPSRVEVDVDVQLVINGGVLAIGVIFLFHILLFARVFCSGFVRVASAAGGCHSADRFVEFEYHDTRILLGYFHDQWLTLCGKIQYGSEQFRELAIAFASCGPITTLEQARFCLSTVVEMEEVDEILDTIEAMKRVRPLTLDILFDFFQPDEDFAPWADDEPWEEDD